MSSLLKTVKATPAQKSIVKTIIKSGIRLYDNSKATLGEIGEIVNTLVVEVKTEKITAAQLVKISVKN
ncbi:MAG: DUF5132 domain-containing protein [Cyanobacteriota bacterium]|nr:DUF5132 domain-containing protein [Cyanobacteriota bacterium]